MCVCAYSPLAGNHNSTRSMRTHFVDHKQSHGLTTADSFTSFWLGVKVNQKVSQRKAAPFKVKEKEGKPHNLSHESPHIELHESTWKHVSYCNSSWPQCQFHETYSLWRKTILTHFLTIVCQTNPERPVLYWALESRNTANVWRDCLVLRCYADPAPCTA